MKMGIQFQLDRLEVSDYNPLEHSCEKASTVRRLFAATGKHVKLRASAAIASPAQTPAMQEVRTSLASDVTVGGAIHDNSPLPTAVSDPIAPLASVNPSSGVRAFRSYASIAVLPKQAHNKSLRSVAQEMKH